MIIIDFSHPWVSASLEMFFVKSQLRLHRFICTPYYFEINVAWMAVQNQAHPQDPNDARNPILQSILCSMATRTWPWSHLLCCFCQLLLLLLFDGLGRVPQNLGTSKKKEKQASRMFVPSPSDLIFCLQTKQFLIRLIRVKLGVAMGHQTDSRIGFLGSWGSRVCAWFLTASRTR